MDKDVRRGLTALIVFAAVFWLGPLLIQYHSYDIRVEVARLAIAVVGAGLYWTGSRD